MVEKISSQIDSPNRLWPAQAQTLNLQQQSALLQQAEPLFAQLMQEERLDSSILPQLEALYLPLAAWIAQAHHNTPLIIGINGAQGSGKSTLSRILKLLLSQLFSKSVVQISIDDLYLSRQGREQLAERVHPLLLTRGVPGTHDVTLGMQILRQLKQGKGEWPLLIPVFDKSVDDLLPRSQWLSLDGPVDIVLFEGWCVGSQPQKESELSQALNTLEELEDSALQWRHYVNAQLAGPYQDLFALIDRLIMLKVPDMDSVFEWRSLQEEKLAQRCKEEGRPLSHVMEPAAISRFIMHYERVTRHTLDEMPSRTDVLMTINDKHQIDQVRLNE